MLVQALDRADQDRNRELLRDVDPRELYEAGLTVMMRLVFLLAAEERALLLLGDPRYDAFYAISSLRMQLRADSEEILERRRSAWSRLLALFRGVYGGSDHPTLQLPALGGSLFDPDRYPFLEGRKKGTSWRSDPAEPLPIDDRTVLLLLDAIQIFEGRTLSYRALDVEQIGHVYEGLLERTVKRVDDVTLELDSGSKAKSPRVTLGEMESARLDGAVKVAELLKERSERSESAIRNALDRTADDRLSARLLSVCRGDVGLRDRILPYAPLLRTDPWGYPLVHHKGAFVVVLGADRRESGTHYTPKSLTEKIVAETLTPVAYRGPAEGKAPEEWELKSAEDLLDLKICDPAMGSGAFLVQACRWLSDRLVEAWAAAEADGKRIDSEGRIFDGATEGFDPLSQDVEERAIVARRLVAERCLYGVDKNPLAVELAKLSLWLTTMSKGRPFGFLDHNLRSGDSLLGIHDIRQLTELSMAPKGSKQLRLFGRSIQAAVEKAIELRTRLRSIPIRDIGDVNAMAALDAESRRALLLPQAVADAFVGIILAETRAAEQSDRMQALEAFADAAANGTDAALERLRRDALADLCTEAPEGLVRDPFHWPLEFPEVFSNERKRFDAVIGNPPFLGGKKIGPSLGDAFNTFVKLRFSPAKGAADLCAYFFRLSFELTGSDGFSGFIATNTISQADTREVGLDFIIQNDGVISFAIPNMKWPGSANLHISVVVFSRTFGGVAILDGSSSNRISSFLTDDIGLLEKPHRLAENFPKASGGTGILGIGFVISPEEKSKWEDEDPRYRDILKPYINGKDLNSRRNGEVSRFVIDFNNLTESQAEEYPIAMSRVRELVKPQRDKLTRQIHEECYWKHWDKREALYEEINKIKSVLCCSFVSKHLIFDVLPTGWIYSKELVVIPSDDLTDFGALQSAIHEFWVRHYSSTLETRLSYSIGDGLRTFPLPKQNTSTLRYAADRYLECRNTVRTELGASLTQIYNLFHDDSVTESIVADLRDAQVNLDSTMLSCYGWSDIQLDFDFRDAKFIAEDGAKRFTVPDKTRLEILRRLSQLNEARYEEEVENGLQPKKASGKSSRAPSARSKRASNVFESTQASLFEQSNMNAVAEKIVTHLKARRSWLSKSDILAYVDIPDGQWNSAINDLLARGTVERQGERRSARYRISESD